MPALLGQSADPERDRIELDGVPLPERQQPTTLLLYKPRGYLCTASDEKGRRTVLELVPSDVRLYPVGRLDLYSEGLLLLTNDGTLAARLTHPSQQIRKVYHLWVSGYTEGSDAQLRRPIVIDGRPIRPPGVRLLSQDGSVAMLEITLCEGRNRQIRRMCEAAGLTVTRLKRVQEGELRLGSLKPGAWRSLTAQELQYLSSLSDCGTQE